jgi:hypothetical protein
MGSLSNTGETALLAHLLQASQTSPATIYLALCTADPTETGTAAAMSEVPNTGAYARTAITFAAPIAGSRRVVQNNIVTFPQATGSWGTVTHYALVDSATHGAGNLLASGNFTSSFGVVAGNTPSVASGQVYVEISASSGAGLTTDCVHKLLNHFFRATAMTHPSTFLALSTTVIDDADVTFADFTEVTGTAYARVEVHENGTGSPDWSTVTAGVADNTDIISFPTVGAGGWSQIVALAVMDSTTIGAGNILGYDSLNVVD